MLAWREGRCFIYKTKKLAYTLTSDEFVPSKFEICEMTRRAGNIQSQFQEQSIANATRSVLFILRTVRELLTAGTCHECSSEIYFATENISAGDKQNCWKIKKKLIIYCKSLTFLCEPRQSTDINYFNSMRLICI